MKNFFAKHISSSILSAMKKFPLSSLLCVILFTFVSAQIITESGPDEIFIYSTLTLIIGFFLTLSIPLLQEKFSKNITFIGYIAVILYCSAFFFFNFQSELTEKSFTFFLIHLVAFGLFPFWIGYSWKKTPENHYENFFSRLVHLILISGVIAFIIGILGNLALWAIGSLFDLYQYSYIDSGEGFEFYKLHLIWTLFAGTIFMPFYAMAKFPSISQEENKNFSFPTIAKFLTKYIEIPFVITYFVILYAYSIKVLVNFSDWPQGIISYLVIIFSVLGYFTYTNARHLVSENNFAKIFVKYFPFAVLFQLPMLFYAIYLRINQYGLTTNRYIIVIFGIILLFISLYFIFSKIRRIVMIPFAFSLVAIFVSIGPWSIFQLPEKLQFNALIAKLEETGRYKNGKIFTENLTILDSEKSYEIIEKINYLCTYRSCEKIAKFFEVEQENNYYYDTRTVINEKLKLTDYRYPVYFDDEKYENFHFHNFSHAQSVKISEISDYDFFVEMPTNQYEPAPKNEFSAFTDTTNKTLIIYFPDGTEEIFDLSNFLENLITTDLEKISELKISNENYEILVWLKAVSIDKNLKTNEITLSHFAANSFFIKKK